MSRLSCLRIMVVEDEYLLAQEVAQALQRQGALVLGPVPTVDRARALLDSDTLPDGAVLDLNLGGEAAFPIADILMERGVPVVFTTGYDHAALPDRFGHILRYEKPVDIDAVIAALGNAIDAGG